MVDHSPLPCYNNYTYAGSFFCAEQGVVSLAPQGAAAKGGNGPASAKCETPGMDRPKKRRGRAQPRPAGRKFIEEVPLCAFE